MVYGATVLFAVGNGLMWPSFMSILSKRAGTVLQGSVQGVAGSLGGLASIIGLTLGGLLYNLVGGAYIPSQCGSNIRSLYHVFPATENEIVLIY